MNQEDEKKFTEQVKEKAARVRQHVETHKTIYLCGVTGIICIVGTRYVYRSGVEDLAKQIMEKMPTPPVINNHNIGNLMNNTVEATANHAGSMHKIVKRIDKFGNVDIWESLGDAARACADQYNLKPSTMAQMISRNANGHIPDVYADVFSYIGTGTS